MSHKLLTKSKVIQSQLRKDLPNFKVGAIVAVHYKYKDGGKIRIQVFKGLVTNLHAVKITSNPKTMNASFTVGKNSVNGTKVERTFLISDPNIDKVEILELRRGLRANLRNLFFKLKDYAKTMRYKQDLTEEKLANFASKNLEKSNVQTTKVEQIVKSEEVKTVETTEKSEEVKES
jgi:large subunit ribosomal protein L19